MNQLEYVQGDTNVKINIIPHQSQEINMEICIKHDTPFHIFINMVMKYVFALESPQYYDDDNTLFRHQQDLISKTERRTLRQLGFKQNSILKIYLKRRMDSEEQLNLSIITSYATGEHQLQIKMNSETPFNVFIVKALKIIFTEEFPGYEVYLRARICEDETLFTLDRQIIGRQEERTLEELGFRNNSVLHIQLKMKSNQLIQ